MAIKKSELYSSLWKSCDELRGGMDASQYKDYVLVLLFVKYVSDKYAGQPGALIEVPAGGSFADMVAYKGTKDIGEKINVIIGTLAADVQTELDRVSQALTGRIRQLADRYATPLPVLVDEVQELAARVDGHLKRMGAV